MQILITGAAGFIGFNLSKYLLKKNIKVFGIDNINDYYSRSLKLDRIKELKKLKKFNFKKIDIRNEKKLSIFLKRKKIDVIIHLAAQAGVRYSLLNPTEFVQNNILGFYNVMNLAKINNIKKIFYASSSSVYWDSNNFPLKENQIINPKNIYSLSKKNNEEMAEIFSKQFDIKLVGLRFFTIYGEWGRPDMFLMKYLKSSFDKTKKFYLNNFGNHTRDFTYIVDACEIIEKLLFSKNDQLKHQILNICSNNPIKLLSIISELNELTTKKPKIYRRKLQEADVIKTHGSNKKVLSIIGNKKFIPIKNGLLNTLNWFKQYYNY